MAGSADLRWVAALIDQISGPAKKISGALGGMRSSLKRTDVALGSMGGAGTIALGALGSAAKVTGSALAKVGSMALGGLATVGVAAAGAGLAVGKMALDVQQSKEQTLTAFKAFMPEAEAKKAQAAVTKMAIAFGDSTGATAASVTELLASGFKFEDALKVYQGALDMKDLVGADVGQITSTFSQIASAGKLTTEDLKQIGITGKVGVGNIKKALGELKGIDTSTPEGLAQITKLIEGGKISADEGMLASLNAIQTLTGGPLGSFSAKANDSLKGLLSTIKNAPENLLQSIDMSAAFAPMKKALGGVAAALDPESPAGKKLIALVERIVGAFGGLGEIDVAGAIGTAIDTFDTLITVLGDVWAGVKGFGENFVTALGDSLGGMKRFGGGAITMQGVINALVGTLKVLGTVLGWTVGITVRAVSFIVEALTPIAQGLAWLGGALVEFETWWVSIWYVKLPDAVADLVGVLGDLWDTFWDFGADIVDGLWKGIKAGWGTLKDGWNGLIDELPASVAEKLKIESPSKVMAELGTWTAEGFAVGVDAGAPSVAQSMADLVAVPSAPAPRGGVSMSPRIEINVNVDGSTHTLGEDIAEQVRSVVIRTFGELSAEMAVA